MVKRNKNYKVVVLTGILLISSVAVINFSFGHESDNVEKTLTVKDKNIDIVAEDVPNEFLQLELTYLGSAKVKKNDIFAWDENGCIVYYDGLSQDEYTYAYRLFSSEEDYESLDNEADFYSKWFKINYAENKMYVCSYGKKLQWIKYNPSWQANTGGLVNRARFEDMEIEENRVYFYEFDFNPLQYGYLADMFREKENPPEEFVNLPLTYVGSAKWTGKGLEDLAKVGHPEVIFEKDGLQYSQGSYYFVDYISDYHEIFVNSNEIYGVDFEIKIKEGKIFILQWGKELEWLQYRPGKKNEFEQLSTRVGLVWDMEMKKDTLFIYECNYDYRINGFLYDLL